MPRWIQTYSEAEVGRYFFWTAHYGYIELFGPSGIFTSSQCRAFIGYWGQGLYYPMHDHEAEEAYLVLAAVPSSRRRALQPLDLGVGGVRIHTSYQKHAMEMRDASMQLCACGGGQAWRTAI